MGAKEDEAMIRGIIQEFTDRIQTALKIAREDGPTDGTHHKQWVIDQMVRALSGTKGYEKFIAQCGGDWDEGIAP